jgi:hypothetical protein
MNAERERKADPGAGRRTALRPIIHLGITRRSSPCAIARGCTLSKQQSRERSRQRRRNRDGAQRTGCAEESAGREPGDRRGKAPACGEGRGTRFAGLNAEPFAFPSVDHLDSAPRPGGAGRQPAGGVGILAGRIVVAALQDVTTLPHLCGEVQMKLAGGERPAGKQVGVGRWCPGDHMQTARQSPGGCHSSHAGLERVEDVRDLTAASKRGRMRSIEKRRAKFGR